MSSQKTPAPKAGSRPRTGCTRGHPSAAAAEVRDRESGVGPAQLSALSVLVFGGPRSLGELADAEQVRPPTMSRIVRDSSAPAW